MYNFFQSSISASTSTPLLVDTGSATQYGGGMYGFMLYADTPDCVSNLQLSDQPILISSSLIIPFKYGVKKYGLATYCAP